MTEAIRAHTCSQLRKDEFTQSDNRVIEVVSAVDHQRTTCAVDHILLGSHTQHGKGI